MALGMYSDGGTEIVIDDLEEYDLYKDFPEEVADVVDGQLSGYGYSYGIYKGNLVRVDMCWSNEYLYAIECSPVDLLEDAIDFRREIVEDEGYADEDAVRELRLMEEYWRDLTDDE